MMFRYFTNAGIAALLLAGCHSPRFAYSPSAQNVPLLDAKNDSKIGLSYSNNHELRKSQNDNSHNSTNGCDFQAAYAVTDHVAIQANYFFRTEKSNRHSSAPFDSSIVNYRRNLFELGAGYFTTIDLKGRIIFELFGGAGFGKLNFKDRGYDEGLAYDRYYKADILKYYIQPAIIFRNRARTSSAALSIRLSMISFRNITTDYTKQESKDLRLMDLNSSPAIFFEPTFVNSYGFKKLPGFRIEYQVGIARALQSKPILDYRTFNFSAGAIFDIFKMIQKQKK